MSGRDSPREDAPRSADRKHALGILAKEEHVAKEIEREDTGGVIFSLEGLLEFRRTNTLLELAHTKPEVPRKRPNYNGHRRRLLVNQLVRVKFLALRPSCVFFSLLQFPVRGLLRKSVTVHHLIVP